MAEPPAHLDEDVAAFREFLASTPNAEARMTEQEEDPYYRVRRVNVGTDELMVELRNGREIVASLGAYPELQNASEEEKKKWRLLAMDRVIEWPHLELRVSLDDLPPATSTW